MLLLKHNENSCVSTTSASFEGFPGGTSGKESTFPCGRWKRLGFDSWVQKIPWRRAWQPSPVFLPGESHGQRSLEGYPAWGLNEWDTEATVGLTQQRQIKGWLVPSSGWNFSTTSKTRADPLERLL